MTTLAASVKAALVFGLGALLGCGERPAVDGGAGLVDTDPTTLERASVRAAYIASRQREAASDPRYAADLKSLTAHNPAQHFQARFGASAIEVNPTEAGSDWKLGLSLKGIGCDGRVEAVTVPGKPHVVGANRVHYDHALAGAPLIEWYENGALGLEQGFTLQKAPCRAAKVVTVVLDVRGLSARSSAAGVELVDGSGQLRLRYTDLYAQDATGRALVSQFEVSRSEVVLRVVVGGAVWPVAVDPLIWGDERKLTASDGAATDTLGLSVALSGDTALVGAYSDDVGANANQGSAYVFVRSGTTWSEQKKLTASDGAASDSFGWSAALSGDTALVGAIYDDVGANADQGSAYVFVRSGTTWSEQNKLTASDGAAPDHFGDSVALSGDTALVGASSDFVGGIEYQGSAYVFVRSGTTWSEQKKLTAMDGADSDSFGHSVALSGDSALVGAHGDQVGANVAQGSAYVFVRSGTTWSEQKKLTASDGAAQDLFAYSVALSGDTALVGAYRDDVGANANQGSAYVFARSGTGWSEQKKLTASDGSASDSFGTSVALTGDTALVGAYFDQVGANNSQGSAYVFVRSGTSWSEQKKLTASDGGASEFFGISVALSEDTALVGAYHDTVGANLNQGSAYVYRFAPSNGDTCSVDSDCLNGHCVDQVCCNVACSGACAACAVAAGADSDGVCKVFDKGSPGLPACAPQACNGVKRDCVDCTLDADCPSGNYCAADGSCQDQKDQGDACNVAPGGDCKAQPCGACASNHCADGVCCESACDGDCEACTEALTSAADGTCSPIPADQDPQDECDPSSGYPDDCQKDGACNGQRACRVYAKAGVACGATTCSVGAVHGKICSGAGQCEDGDVACAPYVCDGAACGESCASQAECDADSGYCIAGGTCAETKPDGQECSSSVECQNGFCVDGVCCESACQAQCGACNEPEFLGKCVAVTGAPRSERKACAGDPDVCGGACDGVNQAACSYPSSKTTCGRTCSNDRETVSTCDAGECVKGNPTGCNGYACGDDACLAECSSDDECQAGFGCVAKECVPKTAQCIDDNRNSRNSANVETPCAPFVCDPTSGACFNTCGSSTDCADGFVCNDVNNKCEAAAAASSDDSGCGCRTVGTTPSAGVSWVWLLVLGAAGLRRRRPVAA